MQVAESRQRAAPGEDFGAGAGAVGGEAVGYKSSLGGEEEWGAFHGGWEKGEAENGDEDVGDPDGDEHDAPAGEAQRGRGVLSREGNEAADDLAYA